MVITVHYGSHNDKAPRTMDFNIEVDVENEDNNDVNVG